jgi:MATE family, multidrug efflux pump
VPSEAAAVAVSSARGRAGGLAEVAAIAGPAVLHTLSDTVMQVVDSAIVGRLGVTELGAVGFAGVWLWTLSSLFVGTASGVQTFVAQEYGAGRSRACGAWAWQGLYALVPVAVAVFAVLWFVVGPFFAALGPSPELHARSVEYAQARLWGFPGVVVSMVLCSFFRGLGDTRTPLLVALVANVVNLVLTYGLVLGRLGLPAIGVAGAGIATSISLWLGAAMLFVAFRRAGVARAHATAAVSPSLAAIRRYLRTSAPIGGQWVLDMASFAVFTTVIARMGDRSMAANQAMIQLLSLSFMQAVGLSIAAGALVGRYVGARDLAAAERAHGSALKLAGVLAMVIAALFLSVPDVLLGIFTSDRDVIALGRPLLVLGALYQLADASGIVASGSLRGAGDTRWPFLVQSTLAWVLRLPLVYVAAIVLDGGVLGAWAAELAFVMTLGVAFLLRFRGGAWRRVRI